MTLLQQHASTGSKTLISGALAVETYYGAVAKRALDSLQETIAEVEQEESEALKDRMSLHPMWAGMVDSARVSVTQNNISYIVEDEGAVDAEYGNPQKEIVASGLLRSQARRRSEDIERGLVAKVLGKASRA